MSNNRYEVVGAPIPVGHTDVRAGDGFIRQSNYDNACGGTKLASPQPGLSTLLGQQESMLAGLSKELAELEDMLEHLRFHGVPTNASAKEQVEPSTSSLGGIVQRNNATIQALAARLDYLKNTLRGML